MICASCGTENAEGRKFCRECGSPLQRACPACGTGNPPDDKFCGECGTALSATPVRAAPPLRQPAAERRLVSVLFADLVGFTRASEGRDAEETRELLTRYFETVRTVIERYGGTVEKFIGDAVMAVWGAPVAQEDDAERAVRAALELVTAVPELDPAVKLRAGVLTGEAAVTLGAEGQGMVAGDLVNTASRIQGAAEPGSVLVGESTRRASEAAIAYADAGSHELKGKAEPVPLWEALRVTAGRAGALKSTGLESPFVGRDRELRLVKELFHACGEEGRSQLISVVGVAGIGKSRLGWEFFKYIDGLSQGIWWHRGRCLAYGEGVAFWALAEMVRMRADIVEGEDPESARTKLRATLQEYVSDEEERRFVEPRLAHLLGLEDGAARTKEELFGAWRILFERLAEQGPLILLFEDLQWADAALVEFISYLIEWSRNHPIFVLCLARPELQARHPEFGRGPRQTTLSLDPLSEQSMESLLDGFVPGLPTELRARILSRAEGVPLYAIETVRMLLDQGLLVQEGGVYRPTGLVGELEVPETLQGLLAARLDGLAGDERRVVQDASVLGKTFTREALMAISNLTAAELEPVLSSLVRKEVLGVQADPRSPERGQYGFLQDLVRRVAYETLAREDRKGRHLAAAAHLKESFGEAEQEIVEVVAAHYLAAYQAQPAADDAGQIKSDARELLARAGERAASLAAPLEAQRYFEQAAELADDPFPEAQLLERAGESARAAGSADAAQAHFERAMELFDAEGLSHPAARVSARLAWVDWRRGRLEKAVERMEASFEILSGDEADEDLALLAAELGRLHYFAGDHDLAAERIDVALGIAEAFLLQHVLTEALTTAALIAAARGRNEQAVGLVSHALKLALEHDQAEAAFRAYNNLATFLSDWDRYEESREQLERGLALGRRLGDRPREWLLLDSFADTLVLAGDWDGALAAIQQIPETQFAEQMIASPLSAGITIRCQRGQLVEARRQLALVARFQQSADAQERAWHAAGSATLLLAEGSYADALAAGRNALEAQETIGRGAMGVKLGFAAALEAALALGDLVSGEELLGDIERLGPGEVPPFLRALQARFRARVSAVRGQHDGVEDGFKGAAAILREFGIRFWLAVTLLEHAEWLAAQGRHGEGEPQLAEAREIFEGLEATPWLERVDRSAPVEAEPQPA